MKVTVEELPGSKREIQVELEEDEVKAHFDKSLNQLAKGARISGFRKGKVPPAILEMKLGKSLQAEVLEEIVSESYEKVRKDEGIVPISPPSIDTGGSMPEKNKAYSFKITVDVRPAVKIDDFKGVVVEKERMEITDEHVDAVLQRKREEHAEFLPVTDRVVMRGDWVLLDGESLLDGKVVQDLSGQLVQAGSDFLPQEMSEALIGCSVGDERNVNSETESGEKVTYRFKVNAIKEKRLLIVDDEFAKDLGGFQSVEELRADIRKKLEAIADIRVKDDLKRQIIDKLVDKAEVEIPRALIERQMERMKVLSKVRGDGTTEKLGGKELEDLAVRTLKEYFVLDEIAKREDITVTDEEVEKAKARIAERRKDTEIDAEDVRSNLVREKVFDLLLSNATINDKEESRIVKPGDVDFIPPTAEGIKPMQRGPGFIRRRKHGTE